MEETLARRTAIWNCYNYGQYTIEQIKHNTLEEGTLLEQNFDQYWSDKQGKVILQQTADLIRKVDIRKVELDCQIAAFRGEFGHKYKVEQGEMPNLDTQRIYTNTMWSNLDRRLLGNELRVPELNGNPMEFDFFWELYEELVHKQPYTNIEKLSILLSCCKGDASRTLKMS
ncbi:hypothetical protein ANCCAN_03094 [Ancylostoma caninum]|uniref:Uncharacterized protein n=1 Tax=Ancylostoma caninum TaxID=29170 RepID=A0A368H2S0_ANCCA|nr:hypothetical protein ANCCAN_03094 [Ancylostoma caninum]